MKFSMLLFLLLALSVGSAGSQSTLEDFLPKEFTYDDAVPTPKSFLGYELGEWHIRHDQLVGYFQELARKSPRMAVEVYGYSCERRPLILATITSPKNLENRERLRENHIDYALGRAADSPGPAIAWMGYGVHGNEASATNVAVLLAYFLAAARGEAIDTFLNQTITLLDPCYNPDGYGRFSQWVNSRRGLQIVGDPKHWEHREAWPGGRTNHYWFDLNRDWLLLVHPESQARVRLFHRWLPHLLTDYHEMGTNSTYFFQPGVPTRQNPWTPAENLELTREIAKYHAEALDREGELYWTEERFDDFYYGKGSTYPDVNGGIGILFEQASARGHEQESINGDLSFPRAIKNQFLTSLSSLRAVVENRKRIAEYQRNFYKEATSLASRDDSWGYLFGTPRDLERTGKLVDLLRAHQVNVYPLEESVDRDSATFSPGSAYVVPLDQRQYRLIKSLFEERTEFEDETFYDVSTWNMAHAYGLPYAKLDRSESVSYGPAVSESVEVRFETSPLDRAYVVAIPWTPYSAPRLAYRLLDRELSLRVATAPFQANCTTGRMSFGSGTLIATLPRDQRAEQLATIQELAREAQVSVYAIESGLTPEGLDLGSPKVKPMTQPVPALVIGPGVSAYDSGSLWHLLDTVYEIPTTLLRIDELDGDLSRYTHLIMADGRYGQIGAAAEENIKRWLDRGGVLVGIKRAAVWSARDILGLKDEQEKEEEPSREPRPYAEFDRDRAVDIVGGAIFRAQLDRTHPMGFGFVSDEVALFRNWTETLPDPKDPYGQFARYAEGPLVCGYASERNCSKIAKTPAAFAARQGRGVVILFADHPNFRGFWLGTQRFIANALFFGDLIDRTEPLYR